MRISYAEEYQNNTVSLISVNAVYEATSTLCPTIIWRAVSNKIQQDFSITTGSNCACAKHSVFQILYPFAWIPVC